MPGCVALSESLGQEGMGTDPVESMLVASRKSRMLLLWQGKVAPGKMRVAGKSGLDSTLLCMDIG